MKKTIKAICNKKARLYHWHILLWLTGILNVMCS